MHSKAIFWAGLALVTLTAIFLGPLWLSAVLELGRSIPQPNMIDDYLFALFWASLLALSIWFWPVPKTHRRVLLWLWAARAAVALVIMLFVEGGYGGMDAFAYFSFSHIENEGWFPPDALTGNQMIVNICRVQRLLTRVDSYHGSKVTFAMIGLIAVYIFYRAAVLFMGEERPNLLWILGLWPSILFWSSILGKEPVALLGVAHYVYGTIAFYKSREKRFLIFVMVGLAEVMLIRVWMGPILLLPLILFVLFAIRGVIFKMTIIALSLVVLWFAVIGIQSRFGVGSGEEASARWDAMSSTDIGGGSGRVIDIATTSPAFLPVGMFTALFRPLPGEVESLFGWAAGLEDLGLLLLFLAGLWRLRPVDLRNPIELWAAAIVVTWSAAYASISFINLGGTARTRLQIMPVFVGLLFYMNRRRRTLTSAAPAQHTMGFPRNAFPVK